MLFFDSIWFAMGLVAAVSVAAAALISWAGIARASVLGGLLAGIILGPTVVGQAFPEWHERALVGGTTERQTVDDMIGQHRAAINALHEAGVSESALVEERKRQSLLFAHAEEAHRSATQHHQRPIRSFALTLAMVVLGVLRPRKFPNLSTFNESLFSFLWTMALMVGVVGMMAVFLFEASMPTALAIGLVFALTSEPLKRKMDSESEEPSHPAVRLMGALGWLGAGVASVSFILMPSVASSPFNMYGPLIGLAFGAALPLVLGNAGRMIGRLMIWFILPVGIALAAVSIDLFAGRAFAAVLIGVIVAADGRWFGAVSGLAVWGVWKGKAREAWRATIPLTDCGALQAALAIIFWASGWFEPNLLLAGLCGAVMADLSVNWRGRLCEMMEPPPSDKPE